VTVTSDRGEKKEGVLVSRSPLFAQLSQPTTQIGKRFFVPPQRSARSTPRVAPADGPIYAQRSKWRFSQCTSDSVARVTVRNSVRKKKA